LAALNTRPVDELRDDQLPLRLPEANRFRWVHVDFQDSRVASPSGFGRYVLQSLGFPVPEPCNMDGFLTVMNASVIAPTVVAMDEVGVALQRHKKLDIDFWDGLRSLSSGVAGPNLSFLLALHEQPYTLAQHNASAGSPFFNLLGYTAELGPLTEDEARQLVNSSPVPVTDDELTWILEASGRWPIILQTLCRERLAALSEGATGSDWHREAQRQAERWSYLLASSRANGPADD
jgi:hypothetical protein